MKGEQLMEIEIFETLSESFAYEKEVIDRFYDAVMKVLNLFLKKD